ncbi:hypothetical protein N2152v2_000169 [Parachlorella kessleri]
MKLLGPARPPQCPAPLKGPNGEALHTGSQRAVGFAEHFKGLLQCGQPGAPEVLQSAAAQPWAAPPDSFAWQLPTEAESLQEYQCGFRPQRSCSDQIFCLRRMSELAVSKQRRLHLAYVDLLKAFDSVNRAALWMVLLQSGLPEVLYGFPGNGALTGLEAAKAARGGSPLRLPLLMLADDIVVLASTAEGLQQFLTAPEAACQRWGLTISQSETELVLVGGAAAAACEGCGALQPERSMLPCNTCEAGWHCGCLNTPLAALPLDGWQCSCSAAAGHTTASAAAKGAQVAAVDHRLSSRSAKVQQQQQEQVLVMSVVLYGCESLALTCAQQHRQDVLVKGLHRPHARVEMEG